MCVNLVAYIFIRRLYIQTHTHTDSELYNGDLRNQLLEIKDKIKQGVRNTTFMTAQKEIKKRKNHSFMKQKKKRELFKLTRKIGHKSIKIWNIRAI